jgi:hypothetical protein
MPNRFPALISQTAVALSARAAAALRHGQPPRLVCACELSVVSR